MVKYPELHYDGNTSLPALHTLKCLCAFLVVMIHVNSPFRFELLPLTQTAVPIFYLISGYFLVGPDSLINRSRITKTLKKIAGIAIVANLVYLLFLAALNFHRCGDFYNILPYFKPSNLLSLLVFGGTVSGHLWYLNAYMFALLLTGLIIKLKWQKIIPFLIFAGLAVAILLGQYSRLTSLPDIGYALNRNGFTIAFPCVMTGACIRIYESRLRNFKYWIAACIAIVIATYAETYFLSATNGDTITGVLAITTIPAAACIFMMFLTTPRLHIPVLSKIGKDYSAHIYIYHIMVMTILDATLCRIIGIESALLVFVLTIAAIWSARIALRLSVRLRTVLRHRAAS